MESLPKGTEKTLGTKDNDTLGIREKKERGMPPDTWMVAVIENV